MSASTTVRWLTTAIAEARKSANFCSTGILPIIDSGLEVAQVDAVKLPLGKKATKELIALPIAPYGKGRKRSSAKVRRPLNSIPSGLLERKNGPGHFRGDPNRRRRPTGSSRRSGWRPGSTSCLYMKGGFFLPHRDSEKYDRMVASLIVVLPNRFEEESSWCGTEPRNRLSRSPTPPVAMRVLRRVLCRLQARGSA
jgi:hypothetical protein